MYSCAGNRPCDKVTRSHAGPDRCPSANLRSPHLSTFAPLFRASARAPIRGFLVLLGSCDILILLIIVEADVLLDLVGQRILHREGVDFAVVVHNLHLVTEFKLEVGVGDALTVMAVPDRKPVAVDGDDPALFCSVVFKHREIPTEARVRQ
jgi:hypothetical protein